MNWLIIAFLAPLLWGISNFIDKFLVSKYFKGGTGTLVIYSCLIGFPVALLIVIFNQEVVKVGFLTALLIALNGCLYVSFLFAYFKALKKTDTSIVIPFFQTIPVLSYLLAFLILGETLVQKQIIASILIIIGAVGICIKFERKKIKLTKEVVWLMLLASFIISLSSVLFKFFAINLDFWTVSFWQYVGYVVFGLIIFMVSKNYRADFLSSFKRNGKKIISLNVVNESLNITAVIIITYTTLLAPLSLVWVITSFQPLFVFILGLILTLFFPHLIKENIERKIIIQKMFFIILMIIGAYLLGK